MSNSPELPPLTDIYASLLLGSTVQVSYCVGDNQLYSFLTSCFFLFARTTPSALLSSAEQSVANWSKVISAVLTTHTHLDLVKTKTATDRSGTPGSIHCTVNPEQTLRQFVICI
ncbi:hypothetical protein T265_06311 [Opisthorchis viverrini]|uniref:Uncharacterized protein n=1 Tax=Opisthorchis viverrini TaxID=6198 RepID=A0A074ZGP7_OPIVI|nr:hypothetical protein T265_06311 [Opisthorchis viverrini]KER26456.1 hypothetical protein T265_06311 [Opisthorchis viverrini]